MVKMKRIIHGMKIRYQIYMDCNQCCEIMTESGGEEGTAQSVIRADQSDHQHQYNKAGKRPTVAKE